MKGIFDIDRSQIITEACLGFLNLNAKFPKT